MLRYLRVVGRMWCFPSTHYVLFKWHFPVHGRPCLQSVIHEVHEIFVVRGRGAWEGISLRKTPCHHSRICHLVFRSGVLAKRAERAS